MSRYPNFIARLLLAGLLAHGHATASTLFGLIDTGELFSSSDGGATWSVHSTLPVRDAVALSAHFSSTELFLASRSGTVYFSSDAGLSWAAQGALPASDLVDLAIAPNGDLFVLTASGSLYRSSDQGKNFTAEAAITGSEFESLCFTTPYLRHYALARAGEVYESLGGGSSWIPRSAIPISDARRIRAIGSVLYVMTETGDVYRSADAASSWSPVGTLSQVGMRGLVRDGGSLAAATREGHVATSGDGASWTWLGSMNQLSLAALASDEPATTGVEPSGSIGFAVGRLFPNPSPEDVSLELRLAAEADVRLSLYDVRGRAVVRPSVRRLGPGRHVVDWRPGVTASGVYFLRVEGGAGRETIRRWVIMK